MARNKASLFFLVVSTLLLQALHTSAAYTPDKCENDALGLEGVEPTTDGSPYEVTYFKIELDVKTYIAETAVQVTVESSAGKSFNKLFLYAKGKSNQVGEWKNIPATLQGVTCQKANDAVKHKNLFGWKVTVEWVAGADLGDVEFRATVVEDVRVFHVVKSETITYQKKESSNKESEPAESNASTNTTTNNTNTGVHSNNLKMFMLLTNLFVFLAYFYV